VLKRTNLSLSRELFNTLIPPVAGGLSVAYTVLHCAGLVTPECTRGVIDPSYHSRHNDRDRPYECDRGIYIVLNLAETEILRALPSFLISSHPLPLLFPSSPPFPFLPSRFLRPLPEKSSYGSLAATLGFEPKNLHVWL